jgi:hypothetical protein
MAKSVVVLAGDDDVFHAGILGQPCNGAGIETGRVKIFRNLFVLTDRDSGHIAVHDPLADSVISFAFPFTAQMRVKPPVDKHGVVAFVEEFSSSGFQCINRNG